MLRLSERTGTRWDGEPFVARLSTDPRRAAVLREQEVFLGNGDMPPSGFRAYLDFDGESRCRGQSPVLSVSSRLNYLRDGDILYINPRAGEVSVLYRRCSASNTIFLTDSCNCRCVMCPQPPREGQDAQWVRVWLDAIPLISPETVELGISGGEPTMVPSELIAVLRACRNYLPNTALQVLTNGRMFNYMSLCRDVAALRHPDLIFGIPLYSDLSHMHNFIVQAQGAYGQTIRGMMNLRRHGQRIEIRVVPLSYNVTRLAALAMFITRNLPFAEHVAFMGLEPIGYARANFDDLWVDPVDYQEELTAATDELRRRGLSVSIYNEQLCVLSRGLWPLARRSISDWKNSYLDCCAGCSVRSECGGFFASALQRHSRAIQPIEGKSSCQDSTDAVEYPKSRAKGTG